MWKWVRATGPAFAKIQAGYMQEWLERRETGVADSDLQRACAATWKALSHVPISYHPLPRAPSAFLLQPYGCIGAITWTVLISPHTNNPLLNFTRKENKILNVL